MYSFSKTYTNYLIITVKFLILVLNLYKEETAFFIKIYFLNILLREKNKSFSYYLLSRKSKLYHPIFIYYHDYTVIAC